MEKTCQLESCKAPLKGRQQKFCCLEHNFEYKRASGYYYLLAERGTQANVDYFRKTGHAIGAENKRRAMLRVVKEQQRKRKLAGVLPRPEPRWKAQTRAEYAFIVECQQMPLEELQRIIQQDKTSRKQRMAAIILEERTKIEHDNTP